MFRKLTALFLAGLLANPLCCCLASDASSEEVKPSCCHAADADELPAPQPEREPCDCDRMRGQVAVADGQGVMLATTPNSLDLDFPTADVRPELRPTVIVAIVPSASESPPLLRLHAQHCVWLV